MVSTTFYYWGDRKPFEAFLADYPECRFTVRQTVNAKRFIATMPLVAFMMLKLAFADDIDFESAEEVTA